MFDMSWGEVMLIGGVALIVIGPKDLPRALRTVGQMTARLKRMAGEFQAQFNEAMREAELDEVRREVDGINRSVSSASTSFNPIQSIRNEIRSAVETPPAPPSNETLAAATAQLQAEAAVPPALPPKSEAETEASEAKTEATAEPPAPPAPPTTGQTP
ncbi:Sec-independent protein translocase protein TatB [Methylobacterium nodulans]|uniref:Sec-independent protein translocase protein TatB n=1 Tax=Methylobacterium nodulans (strain LMG 21967 / CNCM I-2342 / ORS 2060) TaxID=460265 RepID=B8I9T8_METNO|nr:Sec-independent protein translocase protein TatB [Methylobacterium nodulans]ACL57166.1 twin-arginine translocation protein, TatB subunit [Methylobacterium nodulans ORS 2060]